MRTSKLLAMSGAVAAGLVLVTPSMASAHPAWTPTPVVKSSALAAPFNLDIRHGNVLVADGGLNLVGKLKSDGTIKTIAADEPGASGIAASNDGRYLAFTDTVTDEATFENTASGLNIWGPRGKRVYADTYAYEQANNPDQVNTYGVANPSKCVSDELNAAQIPVSYTGQKDSHAYSVAAFKDKWIVADAGANVLWKIDNRGNIKTLSVLPPQPTLVTNAMQKALGLPGCEDVTYSFEPVPTDVEVGPDGYLYVTTLPGGPEDATLGARGQLWKVNPNSGRAWVIASGFSGATNLAIGRHGEIYVAEFYAGKISVVRCGHKSDFLDLPGVVAVETGRSGELWAATMGNQDPPAPGTIVKISGGKAHKQATVQP